MLRSEDLVVERFGSFTVTQEGLKLPFEQVTPYVYHSSLLLYKFQK